MATEKQIAANRANAQKSKGPKTAAGKLRSSRNAYRHGFSCPMLWDPVTSAKAGAIAHAVIGDDPSEDKLTLAVEFARAQLELQRIRAARADLVATIDFDNQNNHEIVHRLQRLVSLDRYERYAHAKRRRALVKAQVDRRG